MKNIFLFLTALFAFVQVSTAQVNWEADVMHTNVRFEVKHTGISFVDGEFRELEGSMTSPSADDFEGARLNFTIQVSSIDTRVPARNAHLLTDDFFNAEKYPVITLKNGVMTKKWGDHYALEGDLTIRDVTKKITFDVVKNGIMTDGNGKAHLGLTAETTIDRTDFNINYNDKLPSGIDAVGKYVRIIVNTELIQQADQ